MFAAQSFSSHHEQRLPLHTFLLQHRDVLLTGLAQVVTPLIRCLVQIHSAGRAHGAVCAERMLVSSAGEMDTAFFENRSYDKLNPVESYSYYPQGQGNSVEERQRRDVQALGSVLHLLITGTTPPPPALRGENFCLAGQEAWPEAFVSKVEQILTAADDLPLPPLEELQAALESTVAAPQLPTVAEEGDPPLEEATPPPPPLPPAPLELTLPAPLVTTLPLPPVTPEVSQPARPLGDLFADSAPPQRLPNAMVGRAFSAPLLQLLSTAVMPIASIEAEGAMPGGLVCAESTLQGTPTESGEFELVFRGHPTTLDATRPATLTRRLLLTINPDPKSLWKNIPSNPDIEFWKPDTDAHPLNDSPCMVVGASLRGRSHAHVGSCRDDDFTLAWLPTTGWYSLTVADGAGSAKFSRQGAKIAVEHVRSHFTRLFETSPDQDKIAPLVEAWAADQENAESYTSLVHAIYAQFGAAAFGARKAIEDKATSVNAVAKDFHTTLITVLARPLANGSWFVAAFSVGDGAAALVGVPGESGDCLLTKPDGGEFAGQTVFLTMKEALSTGEAVMNRIRCAIVPSFDALILVTDGISDPRFDSETLLADPSAWASLWAEIRPLLMEASTREEASQRLLQWMNFASPGHHDDRTTVVLCPTRQPATTA